MLLKCFTIFLLLPCQLLQSDTSSGCTEDQHDHHDHHLPLPPRHHHHHQQHHLQQHEPRLEKQQILQQQPRRQPRLHQEENRQESQQICQNQHLEERLQQREHQQQIHLQDLYQQQHLQHLHQQHKQPHASQQQQHHVNTRSTPDDDDDNNNNRAYDQHAKDICQLETFEPVCPEGKTMLIERAEYGRMNVGRCINRNYYIGCSANVLGQVHQRCSMRSTCRLSVPDHSLLKNSACPKDLVAFLTVKYSCIKVLDILNFQCSHKGQARINLDPIAYITGRELAHLRSTGGGLCKILIAAKQGQFIRVTLHEISSRDISNSHWLRTRLRRRRPLPTDHINPEHMIGHVKKGQNGQPISNEDGIKTNQLKTAITMLNNTATTTELPLSLSATTVTTRKAKRSKNLMTSNSEVKDQHCTLIALIAEINTPDQTHAICRAGHRIPYNSVVYTSSGSNVYLVISFDSLDAVRGGEIIRSERMELVNDGGSDDDDDGDDVLNRYGGYLLSFEAYSCPDLDVTLGPSEFKVNRKGDQVDVICPSSQEIWSLSCVNDTWIGDLGRCDEERNSASTTFEFHWRSAYGGWFAATVCIALGGVLSVGLIGVVISQRRRNCYKLFPPKSSSSSSSSAHHLKHQRQKSGQGSSITRGDLIHCNLIGCSLDQSRVDLDHANDLHLCTDPLFCTNDSLFCHPDPVFCDLTGSPEIEVKFCEDCRKRLSEHNSNNKLTPSCRVCRSIELRSDG